MGSTGLVGSLGIGSSLFGFGRSLTLCPCVSGHLIILLHELSSVCTHREVFVSDAQGLVTCMSNLLLS